MMRRPNAGPRLLPHSEIEESSMWYAFGGLAVILYLVLIITLGMATLRNGHLGFFIVGIFFPIFWIFGALSRPRTQPV
jgi:hypothetical protein